MAIAVPKKKKEPSIKKLELKLRSIFYPLIKKRDGNVCISCGHRCDGRNQQAGHYAKAELCNIVVRYDERNINTQCSGCNKWKAGNVLAYRNGMIKKYGIKVVEWIDNNYNARLPMDFNEREFLTDLIKKYKELEALDPVLS